MKAIRWVPAGLAVGIAIAGCAPGDLSNLLQAVLGHSMSSPSMPFPPGSQPMPAYSPPPFAGDWTVCGGAQLTIDENPMGDITGSVTSSMVQGDPGQTTSTGGGSVGGAVVNGTVAGSAPSPTPFPFVGGAVQDMGSLAYPTIGTLTGFAQGIEGSLDFLADPGSPWSPQHLDIRVEDGSLVGSTSTGMPFYATRDPSEPNPTCEQGGFLSHPMVSPGPAPSPYGGSLSGGVGSSTGWATPIPTPTVVFPSPAPSFSPTPLPILSPSPSAIPSPILSPTPTPSGS